MSTAKMYYNNNNIGIYICYGRSTYKYQWTLGLIGKCYMSLSAVGECSNFRQPQINFGKILGIQNSLVKPPNDFWSQLFYK